MEKTTIKNAHAPEDYNVDNVENVEKVPGRLSELGSRKPFSTMVNHCF